MKDTQRMDLALFYQKYAKEEHVKLSMFCYDGNFCAPRWKENDQIDKDRREAKDRPRGKRKSKKAESSSEDGEIEQPEKKKNKKSKETCDHSHHKGGPDNCWTLHPELKKKFYGIQSDTIRSKAE